MRIGLGALVLTVAWLAVPASRAEEAAAALPAVSAPPPVEAPAPPPLDEVARGTVRPSKQVTLLARLDGVVEEVLVEEGAVVAEDQLLVRLDASVQAARVAAARAAAGSSADVRAAELEIAEKGAVLARTEKAAKQGAATDWELRVARHAAAQARAKLQAANERHALDVERLAQEEALAKQYELVAPFSGRVTRLDVEAGATVTKDTKLLTVVALEELEAVLFLPVAWFASLEVGKEYALAAEAPVAGPLGARLMAIEPIIDPGSRTVRCVFSIANPDGKLPAGFSVTLEAPN
jgi:RND family efflux transporter MFP subunit